jgi:2-polyprenyl-3-methyl-5-hydroxy-6-metoxy-1,4-benzoquinol methylase
MTEERYGERSFDFSPTELERLRLLEDVADPGTIQILAGLGIQPGWRCLEVGAGAGSIARRLAEAAGATTVVATDVNVDYLSELEETGVRVLQHDVTSDPAPGQFDLIHIRHVLVHLRQRHDVITRLASWLSPGGYLVVEDGWASRFPLPLEAAGLVNATGSTRRGGPRL